MLGCWVVVTLFVWLPGSIQQALCETGLDLGSDPARVSFLEMELPSTAAVNLRATDARDLPLGPGASAFMPCL